MAVAVVWASAYSSDWTPRLGTSVKKPKKKKKKEGQRPKKKKKGLKHTEICSASLVVREMYIFSAEILFFTFPVGQSPKFDNSVGEAKGKNSYPLLEGL